MHPWRVDANLPIYVSTPYILNTLSIIAKLALPEIGLNIAIGNTSFGNFIKSNTGLINWSKKLTKPLDINILVENIIASKDGNIPIPISSPSFAPLINYFS